VSKQQETCVKNCHGSHSVYLGQHRHQRNLPPTTLAFKYFLSECMVCQKRIRTKISSRNSAPCWTGHLGGQQK